MPSHHHSCGHRACAGDRLLHQGRPSLAKVKSEVEAENVKGAEAEAEAKAETLVDNAEAIVTKDSSRV